MSDQNESDTVFGFGQYHRVQEGLPDWSSSAKDSRLQIYVAIRILAFVFSNKG